eukprot:COSAG02_NODE_49405_length_327_cov_0.657895_1_plen_29_part_10
MRNKQRFLQKDMWFVTILNRNEMHTNATN